MNLGKNSITKDNFTFHINKTSNRLAYAFITDKEYPTRVAFDGINELKTKIDSISIKQNLIENSKVDFELDSIYLETIPNIYERFKDPLKVDKILKIKKDLDDTKQVLLVSR